MWILSASREILGDLLGDLAGNGAKQLGILIIQKWLWPLISPFGASNLNASVGLESPFLGEYPEKQVDKPDAGNMQCLCKQNQENKLPIWEW